MVAKPDQCIKRRGKLGLVCINKSLDEIRTWTGEQMGKEVTVGTTVGKLDTFIVEPFLPHKQSEEYYVCIYATRDGNTVLFYHEGGVDIGDVDSKAKRVDVTINSTLTLETAMTLVTEVPDNKRE